MYACHTIQWLLSSKRNLAFDQMSDWIVKLVVQISAKCFAAICG